MAAANQNFQGDLDLTPEQTDILLQFQDLTGIEDIAVCRHVLQLHNWDLEVAVQDQLNVREGRPSIFSDPSRVAPPAVLNSISPRYVYPPAESPSGFRGLVYFVFSYVFHFCYSTFSSIFQFALRLIRPDPRRFVNDPLADVLSFIQGYRNRYGDEHPVFYRGTYSQALSDAKQELRFLLVYLHCEDHQDTTWFCTNTLGNPEVVHYINSNMLFWACSVTSPEGYRVSQALRENGYPFLAVIVLRDNRMTVVGRLEGPVEPQQLVAQLRAIVADNEASLIAARADRNERSFNQTLRQQQDEAYLESLRADEEKERRRLEVLQRSEEEERQRKAVETAEILRKEEIQRQKVELVDRVPAEPPPDQSDIIRLLIKLPNGARLERRFLRTESLQSLYYYVFCHPQSPDEFEITTNFPKRTLQCQACVGAPKVLTFAEAGLGRSEVLFVHDLDA